MRTMVPPGSGVNYCFGTVMRAFYRQLINPCLYCHIAHITQDGLVKYNDLMSYMTSITNCFSDHSRAVNHQIPIDLFTNQSASQRPAVSSLEAYPTPAR